jgi:prepilin-type processing-associated H-X9-DG protein
LLELLVVIAIVAVLAALLIPAMTRARGKAELANCLGNVRQLSLAHRFYADDNRGVFPLRRTTEQWPSQLRPYYRDLSLLHCPSDRRPAPPMQRTRPDFPADLALRSYLLNGWNDYFSVALKIESISAMVGKSVPEQALSEPQQTIVFGEKRANSTRFYMDFLDGPNGSVADVQRDRHGARAAGTTGGSNYAFADGSARFVRFRGVNYPLYLWAVTEQYRGDRQLRQ